MDSTPWEIEGEGPRGIDRQENRQGWRVDGEERTRRGERDEKSEWGGDGIFCGSMVTAGVSRSRLFPRKKDGVSGSHSIIIPQRLEQVRPATAFLSTHIDVIPKS